MADNPLKFVVRLGKGRKHDIDLQKLLAVSEDNLNSALSRQPEENAWIGTLYAFAQARSEKIKSNLEKYESELDQKIRENRGDKYWDSKNDKLTEAKIRNIIKSDERRDKILLGLRNANEQLYWLQAAKEASSQRLHCLISLGANRRSEREIRSSIKEGK